MANLKINALLKVIQSDELETVYIYITRKAEEWALAGFVDEANQLLEVLWGYGMEHSRHLWCPDQGFQMLWEVSGKRPSGIPFAFIPIEEIEAQNQEAVIIRTWGGEERPEYLNRPFAELEDSQLFSKAFTAAKENTEPVAEILAALERCLQDVEGRAYFSAATAATYLAAQSGLDREAKKFLRLWGEGYLKWDYNYSVSHLTRDRATARYLLRGILAPVFGFTKETIQKETAEISAALSQRMQRGRTLPYGHLSWRELLDTISKMAIEQRTNRFSQEAVDSNWLGRAGADKGQIQAAEKYLGVVLPENYKAFLEVSNGFDSITAVGASLAPVEHIDYLNALNKEFVEEWISTVWSDDIALANRFRKSIVIGGFEEEQQVFLVPDENNGWECWFFASWNMGETKYPSFRFYMEQQLQDLEAQIFSGD